MKETQGTKLCLKCKATKPVSEFFKDKTRKDGLSPYCKSCRKVEQKEDRTKNKDKRYAQQKLYVAANPEKVVKWRRDYVERNPDKVKASKQAYYDTNRDDILQKRSQRNRDNPEQVLLDGARIRARDKSLPFSITIEDVIIPDLCPLLGIPLKKGTGKIQDSSPSLDRVRPELGYVPGNVAVISTVANRIKNSGTAEQHRRIADWIDGWPHNPVRIMDHEVNNESI